MIVGTLVNIVMTVMCAYPLSRKEFTARNKVAMIFVFTMYFSGGLDSHIYAGKFPGDW